MAVQSLVPVLTKPVINVTPMRSLGYVGLKHKKGDVRRKSHFTGKLVVTVSYSMLRLIRNKTMFSRCTSLGNAFVDATLTM